MSAANLIVSDHIKHLTNEELYRYHAKLGILGACDPYEAHGVLFTSLTAPVAFIPDLEFGDNMVYLVENPSPYTLQTMKAYKSKESYKYFRAGWVNDAKVWHLKSKKMTVIIARISEFIPIILQDLHQYNFIFCRYFLLVKIG